MKIQVRNNCADYNSYRAARVKSLFNCESGANFSIDADLDIDDKDWKIGLIVGSSGSGKTSIGKQIFGDDKIYRPNWPRDEPIIDAISDSDFNSVTANLTSVGLGFVPPWLRPYHALSNGEKFRADLAKVLCERNEKTVIDEFTSVVDRQIAKIGACVVLKKLTMHDHCGLKN
jgi:ABC-type ATPase with predicted acetyltransferase domain